MEMQFRTEFAIDTDRRAVDLYLGCKGDHHQLRCNRELASGSRISSCTILTFSPFATKSDEYECRNVCQTILFLIPFRNAGVE
jgi:hypothetical protein